MKPEFLREIVKAEIEVFHAELALQNVRVPADAKACIDEVLSHIIASSIGIGIGTERNERAENAGTPS